MADTQVSEVLIDVTATRLVDPISAMAKRMLDRLNPENNENELTVAAFNSSF